MTVVVLEDAAADIDSGRQFYPETGMVIITSSPNGWMGYSLLDLNTGKCSSLPDTPVRFFVKKEVAEKWIELTK